LYLCNSIKYLSVLAAFQTLTTFLSRSRVWALLWTGLILVLCTIPGKELPGAPVAGFDKIVHLGLFGVWTVLWLLARPRRAALVLVAGVVYGVFLEYYQQMLPFDRSFDWWDAAADAAGVAAGYLAWRLWEQLTAS
jgi:VanZ family protein